MDLDIGIVAVNLARKQRLDAFPLDLLVQALQGSFAFRDGGNVAFRLAKLDERDVILEIALEAAEVPKDCARATGAGA